MTVIAVLIAVGIPAVFLFVIYTLDLYASRTFRLVRELPAGFEATPLSMPRGLAPRLAALDAKLLTGLLEELVSKAQIKALLKRRDKILDKLERDRKEYGDELVFVDR